jgi:dihydrofolate reductase
LSNVMIIAAVDSKGGFAKDNKIPWHYREDFRFFKETTMGRVCVMGRNTYTEINEKLGDTAKESVLPGRKCYVVSETLDSLPNATVIRNLNGVVEPEFFVIGGHTLFNKALEIASTVYLTHISKDYQCDMFFNLRYLTDCFSIVETRPGLTEDLTFITYKRK